MQQRARLRPEEQCVKQRGRKWSGTKEVPRWARLRLPNMRSRRFIEQARRESKLISASPFAADDQAFVDSISWLHSEGEPAG